MADVAAASLDTAALSLRITELAGDERHTQVDFLLHLDVFDQRRAWAEAGYPSLWEWCVRALHLSEGAAGRRIAAMRVLRRFPSLTEPLRDGRISLSSATVLGSVLTEGSCEGLVQRAAFKTKAETEHLVASLQPRHAPREGLRRLPRPAQAPAALSKPLEAGCVELDHGGARAPAVPEATSVEPLRLEAPAAQPSPPQLHVAKPAAPRRATLEPIDADTYSLRVTVDTTLKKDLEELKSLLAHKVRNGDLGEVLREAVKCALEKHGKRRGAVEPSRQRKSPEPGEKAAPALGQREPIPAAMRREVWRRDGGRCAWCSPDGHRCESTLMLELDHIEPVALGGRSTAENLRLCCRTHNTLHAEHVFGREHMDLFRKDAGRSRPSTIAGGSTSGACGEGAETAGST